MKKVFYAIITLLLFMPMCVKAEEVSVNSALLFKAYLSTGADIKITGDFTIDGNYAVNAPSTVDLNGHTIDFAGKTLVPYENLTIKDTSADQTGKIKGTASFLFQIGTSTNPGSLTIDSGTIECNGSYGIRNFGTFVMNGGTVKGKAFVIYNQGDFEMNDGSVISSNGIAVWNGQDSTFTMNDGLVKLTGNNYAVSLSKPGAKAVINGGTIEAMYSNSAGTSGGNAIGAFKNTEVEINGGTISAFGNTIMGNGSDSGSSEGTNAKFTVNDGTINSTVGAAIYAPQVNGVTTITGGTLNGKTGIEIRAGKLEITGGTINADTSDYVVTDNSNGLTTRGTAISVAQHTTLQPIEVIISGGEFNGNIPFSETNPLNNSQSDIEKITLDISGGDFTSTGDKTVTVLGDGKFITGGTYTKSVIDYVKDGYGEKDLTDKKEVLPFRSKTAEDSTNGDYTLPTGDSFPGDVVTLDINPDNGYELDEIIVLDNNGARIPVNGSSFVMPNSNVTIQVNFKEANNPATGDSIINYVFLFIISLFSVVVIRKVKINN